MEFLMGSLIPKNTNDNAANKVQSQSARKRKYVMAVFFASVTLILYLLGWVL